MTDSKPYIIRAMYEWICDNDLTPYLYVDARVGNLLLPDHLYNENPLILNISPISCQQLQLGNEEITFRASFSGKLFDIYLPINSIMAIVARENGQGITFDIVIDEDDNFEDNEDTKDKKEKQPRKKRTGLKVVR